MAFTGVVEDSSSETVMACKRNRADTQLMKRTAKKSNEKTRQSLALGAAAATARSVGTQRRTSFSLRCAIKKFRLGDSKRSANRFGKLRAWLQAISPTIEIKITRFCILSQTTGRVAQMAERSLSMGEVRGSMPRSSTFCVCEDRISLFISLFDIFQVYGCQL